MRVYYYLPFRGSLVWRKGMIAMTSTKAPCTLKTSVLLVKNLEAQVAILEQMLANVQTKLAETEHALAAFTDVERPATQSSIFLDVSRAIATRKELLAALDQQIFETLDRINALQSTQRELRSDQLIDLITQQRATELVDRLREIDVNMNAQNKVLVLLYERIGVIRAEFAELEKYTHARRVIKRGLLPELLLEAPRSASVANVDTQPISSSVTFPSAPPPTAPCTVSVQTVIDDTSQTTEERRAQLVALAAEHNLDSFLLLMVTLFDLLPGASHRATSKRVMDAAETSGVFTTFGYSDAELILKRRAGWGGSTTHLLRLFSDRSNIAASPVYVRTPVVLPWSHACILSSLQIRAFRRCLHA